MQLISASTPASNRPRQPLDILTLSENGIQSARENISKRLTNTDRQTVNASGVADRKASLIATDYKGVDDSKENATKDGKNKPLTETKVCVEGLKIVHSNVFVNKARRLTGRAEVIYK